MEQISSPSTSNSSTTNIDVIPEGILSQVTKLNISGEDTNIPEINSVNNEKLAVKLNDQDTKKDLEEDAINCNNDEADNKTMNLSKSESSMVPTSTESHIIPKCINKQIRLVISKPKSDKTENESTNDGLDCVDKQVINPNEFVNTPVSSFQPGCEQNLEIQKNNMSSNLRLLPPKSVVILNKKSDSLKNLLVYDSDDSSTPCSLSGDSEEEAKDVSRNSTWQTRVPATTGIRTSDAETDSTLSESTDNEDEEDFNNSNSSTSADDSVQTSNATAPKNKVLKPEKPKKEEDILPPVPDLSTINFDQEEFWHMGVIAGIVDKLVTIEALPGVPAYDLDSYLFIDQDNQKKPLGAIFDVLGPVTAPIYCVRFNTSNDIQDLKLHKGLEVFVAPKSKYSKYIFVSELMKFKGTDASWRDDEERPGNLEDFSDDEKEQEAKREQKRAQLKRRPARPVNLPPKNLFQPPSYPSAPLDSNTGHVAVFDPSVPPPWYSAHTPPGTAPADHDITFPSVSAHPWNNTFPFRSSPNNERPSDPLQPNNQPLSFMGPPRGRAASHSLHPHMTSRFYPPGPSYNYF